MKKAILISCTITGVFIMENQLHADLRVTRKKQIRNFWGKKGPGELKSNNTVIP